MGYKTHLFTTTCFFTSIDMMSTLEVCILCGHILYPGVGRRYKKYGAMTDLISRKCTPTAFVYACVTKYTGDVGKHTVCIACVNWTRSVHLLRLVYFVYVTPSQLLKNASLCRRLSLRQTSKTIFIPMDNVLLFIMQPGKFIEPDKRTLVRLLRSLCTQYTTGPASKVRMCNQYTCFESGAMQAVKRVLTEKYFTTPCIDITATEVKPDHLDGITDYYKDSIIDLIIREWWVFNGMPTFLQDKTTGRYVRRMLRAHKMRNLIDTGE
jgi:hypothetical protein